MLRLLGSLSFFKAALRDAPVGKARDSKKDETQGKIGIPIRDKTQGEIRIPKRIQRRER